MKEILYLKQQQNNESISREDFILADTIIIATAVAAGNCDNSMPCWYYDKKELRDTPSVHDGISFETERRYRKEGARFIMSCGTQMGLGHNTMATGVVYFHRFYMFHSFKSFPRYVTACCCLFLAGKVEETPKKARDIIKTARALLDDTHFYSFGEDPKEEVMTLERILLQTIKFDLQVEHPYTFLLKYAKCFKGDQQKLQKMVQMAWNFVNDSLSTVVCLQWEPEIIAVALIHLASKLSKFTLVDWVGRQSSHLRWWDMFVSDVTMEILEDICHQVLDLYQPNQKDAAELQSPPQKPPSRADSPTPLKPLPSTSNSTGSPAATAAAKAKPVTAALAIPSITGVGEINNIQAIKSLANNSAPMAVDPMSAAALSSNYHMYAPPPPVNPHQMHSIYGSAAPAPPPPPPHGYGAGPLVVPTNSSVVTAPPPLPPPPPMPPYGGAPAQNTWAQASMGATHYATGGGTRAPPPPPPGQAAGGGGGYYQQSQQPPYGRQQRY